jgi:hypothetical protein
MVIPLIQTVLARAAGADRLARVMGVVGMPATLALGGVIVSDASWRLISTSTRRSVWRRSSHYAGSGCPTRITAAFERRK